MFNKIKEIINLYKENERLKDEIDKLKIEKSFTIKPKAENIIKDLMNGQIEWYNYEDLSFTQQISYWQDAQGLLKNQVFNNEVNHFINILIKEIAKDAKIDNIPYLRAGIIAIEALRKHIETIKNPHKEESVDEIYHAI